MISFGHVSNIICTHAVKLKYNDGFREMFHNIKKVKLIKDKLTKNDFLVTIIGRQYDKNCLNKWSVWDKNLQKFVIIDSDKKPKVRPLNICFVEDEKIEDENAEKN